MSAAKRGRGTGAGLDDQESPNVTEENALAVEQSARAPGRFVTAERVIEIFRDAPAIDYARFRSDPDNVAAKT